MDALFAKKNKKKGKKSMKAVNLFDTGAAIDLEDPTEKIQRMKVDAAKKSSLKQQTTDSDWNDSVETTEAKPVIITSGKTIGDLG